MELGELWDKNRCPRLPVGVTAAGILLNHPGVNTQVFWPQTLRGTHPADWIFCQVLHSLPLLTYYYSQKGSPLLCDIPGPGSLRAPELPLHDKVSPTH